MVCWHELPVSPTDSAATDVFVTLASPPGVRSIWILSPIAMFVGRAGTATLRSTCVSVTPRRVFCFVTCASLTLSSVVVLSVTSHVPSSVARTVLS